MTYLQIIQESMRRLGEQTIPTTLVGTTDNIQLNLEKFVNRIYHQVEVLKEWWWLEETARLRTFAKYTTGTVTTTDGDATVVGTSTAWATGDVPIVGDLFKLDGERHHYEILSVTDDTNLELTSDFIGTNSTATNYQIVRQGYSLPSDFNRMKQVVQLKTNQTLTPLPYHDFLERVTGRGSIVSAGVPEIFTVYGLDASDQRVLLIDPQPKDEMDLEVRYTKTITELSADADTPALPTKYHELFIDGVMAMHYKHISDDSRAGIAAQDFEAYIRQMVQEQDAHDTGDFQLKVDMHDKAIQLSALLFETQNEATLRIWDAQT